jgi:hypothetical protein
MLLDLEARIVNRLLNLKPICVMVLKQDAICCVISIIRLKIFFVCDRLREQDTECWVEHKIKINTVFFVKKSVCQLNIVLLIGFIYHLMG